MSIRNGRKQAYAIRINGRFFYEISRTNRVMTAWSLAGARLFLHHGDIDTVCAKLEKRGKQFEVVTVELVGVAA